MYVYILRSIGSGVHYTGMTNDIMRRFHEHNGGLVSKTKHLKPFQIIHVEIVKDRLEARKFEKYFKSGYGREIVREIEQEIFPL